MSNICLKCVTLIVRIPNCGVITGFKGNESRPNIKISRRFLCLNLTNFGIWELCSERCGN